MQSIPLFISPCPNDTFIFDGLIHQKINTEGITYQHQFYDIEELNNLALQNTNGLIKISAALWPAIKENYNLLSCGGAMGYGVGPLLVHQQSSSSLDLKNKTVILPGQHTTAHFLFKYFYPQITNAQKKFMLFSDIEPYILNHENTMGVLIHEGRFTYADKGLTLINDLGKLWQEQESLPIPLGIIIAHKSIDPNLLPAIEAQIKASIKYSWNNYPTLSTFVKKNAQEMSEEVMRQHINLYVNEFSEYIGKEGHSALDKIASTLATMA
jgi:1,4-dihydroxy-6-naphthoate synthase